MPRYLARINVDCAMDSSSYSSVLFFVLSDYPANGLDHHQRVSTSDDDFDAWATKDSFSSTPTLLPLAECIIPRPYSLFHYTDTQRKTIDKEVKESKHPQWPTISSPLVSLFPTEICRTMSSTIIMMIWQEVVKTNSHTHFSLSSPGREAFRDGCLLNRAIPTTPKNRFFFSFSFWENPRRGSTVTSIEPLFSRSFRSMEKKLSLFQ